MRFWSLDGLTGYEEARALQIELVRLRAEELIPDTVLFLEHRPVITRGRGLQHDGSARDRHMPFSAAQLGGAAGVVEGMPIEFRETERGGDLTYHGPGQLVVYPICKLDGRGWGPDKDIATFIRKLEGTLISVLASGGLEAQRRENATGVWVGGKKVASVGIAVRKWVTFHGMAINCVNDLSPFGLFSPCGFAPEIMTRVKDLLPDGSRHWRAEMEQSLAQAFCDGPELRRAEGAHAVLQAGIG